MLDLGYLFCYTSGPGPGYLSCLAQTPLSGLHSGSAPLLATLVFKMS